MLLRDLLRTHRGVTDGVRGLRTVLKEAAPLDDPVIAVGIELPIDEPSCLITLLLAHLDGVLTHGPEAHLVADVRAG